LNIYHYYEPNYACLQCLQSTLYMCGFALSYVSYFQNNTFTLNIHQVYINMKLSFNKNVILSQILI